MRSNTQSFSHVQIGVYLFCFINIKIDMSSYYWSQILWYDEGYNYLVFFWLSWIMFGRWIAPIKKEPLYDLQCAVIIIIGQIHFYLFLHTYALLLTFSERHNCKSLLWMLFSNIFCFKLCLMALWMDFFIVAL